MMHRKPDGVAANMHVVKVPTSNRDLFPYTHYMDEGHHPLMTVSANQDEIVLNCRDWFKLKPNVQQAPRIRMDIYMPGGAGLLIAKEISRAIGEGEIAELSSVNPEDYRDGPQTLPKIDESRKVQHVGATIIIAGFQVDSPSGDIFIDMERPNEGHIEMKGPEIHLGIPLEEIWGELDKVQIRRYIIPQSELRVAGEKNPVPKALGEILIFLDYHNARSLAATFSHYNILERS